MKLEGRIAIVTGGAKGIGAAIAGKLSAEGASVVVADLDETAAKERAGLLSPDGSRAAFRKTDVTDPAGIEDMVEFAVDRFGRIDILVNNAGIQIRRPSMEFRREDWDRLMDINLKAVFFCSQEAALRMKASGGGAIVNISSATSTNTLTGRAPYCISKAGVNALTSVLGAEWAPEGIRVNAVAPGWILTDLLREGMRLGVVSEDQILSVTPIGRMATPGEIADAVCFLCGDESRYIVGQTIFVDGGWSAIGLPIAKYLRPQEERI